MSFGAMLRDGPVTPLRILVAGPVPTTAACLAAALRRAGVTILRCAVDDAVQSVRLDGPDVVLLDPTRAGSWLAACAIRRVGHDVGIVAVADADVTCEEVETWLDQADDLLIGCLDPREILAHCRAVDRRRRGHATGRLEVRGVGIDARSGDVTVNGDPVHLTRNERLYLAALLRRADTIVRRETLLLDLYGDGDWPDPKIVDVMVCKIRQRLVPAGAPADLIETVWGEGIILRRRAGASSGRRRAA